MPLRLNLVGDFAEVTPPRKSFHLRHTGRVLPSWRLALCAMVLAGVCCAGRAAAQQSGAAASADDELAKQRAAWRELLDRQPAQYKIRRSDEDRSPLVLYARPVLRWANYTRLTIDVREAATYIWTYRGRPEAVGCVFPVSPKPLKVRLDLQSLSPLGFVATRQGRQVWAPTRPGVERKLLPDAPVPAESPAARLRQMKSLAGRFSSTLLQWRDDGGDREKLRMLPQPVYRYESEDPDLVDGAMFFFVQGTDPETLLLLEAVRGESGLQWQFAMARRSSGSLLGQYDGRTVWEVDRDNWPTDPSRTRIELDHQLDF